MRLCLINGRVLSAKGIETKTVIIDGDRIAKVGDGCFDEDLEHVFDLNGRILVPGFIDSHVHFVDIGLNLSRVDLSETISLKDALDRAKERLDNESGSTPLICVNFDESRWKENRIPKKEELDRLCPNRAVIFRRVCGHIAIANTAALKKIPGEVKKIDYKSGILLEDVVLFINDIFPPNRDQIAQAIIQAQNLAHSLGVTSLHDMTLDRYVNVYKELEARDRLRLRIYAVLPFKDIENISNYDGEWLKIGGVKLFSDGSIGARTAALKKPYPGTKNYGYLNYTREELNAIVRKANRNGVQLLIHAIGDRAIEQVLDAYENEIKENQLRHRIEHFELADDTSIVRAGRLGILIAMQPNFISNWGMPGGLYQRIFGSDGLRTNRFRTILETGNKICFGSDSMPIGPIYGIKGAIEHPKESISFEDAVKMYTISSAYAGSYEGIIGSIEEGKKADLVILSGEAPDLKVDMTIVNGEIVYETED